MERRHGGYAFSGATVGQPGMTLRDYFAAHAPLPSYETMVFALERMVEKADWSTEQKAVYIREALAETAYRWADAMLAERDKKDESA